MASRVVFILLTCVSYVAFGCQRSGELLAIVEDVVTLNCSYNEKFNSSLTLSWVTIASESGTITNGSQVVADQTKYSLTDDREEMTYNLEIKTDSTDLPKRYVCSLSDGESATELYYGYSLTVLPKPKCSLKAKQPRRRTSQRGKKIDLRCSWNASALSKPLLVSWVQIHHPDVLDEETIMEVPELNTATNTSQYQLTLSPEHYGDTFACVARTETSNNTIIGCSYVALTPPDITITQNGDSVIGEIALFTCNVSGFLTNDFGFSWTIDGVSIMELEDNHFKLISDNVLKINALELADDGLDIKCLVTEDDITFSAQFSVAVQDMPEPNSENIFVVTGISVAGFVVICAAIVGLVIVIKRFCNSRKIKEGTHTNTQNTAKENAHNSTSDGDDSYLALQYPHSPSAYETLQSGKSERAPNEEPSSNDDYTDLGPQYESVETSTRSKKANAGDTSKRAPQGRKTTAPKKSTNKGSSSNDDYTDLGPRLSSQYASLHVSIQSKKANTVDKSEESHYANQTAVPNDYAHVYDYAEPVTGIKIVLERDTVYANVL